MKRLAHLCFFFLLAGAIAGAVPARAAEPARDAGRGTVEKKAGGDRDTARDRDADSGISAETGERLDRTDGAGDSTWGSSGEPERKEFVSVRRKKKPFTFQMGFSIGGMGYGILGPRAAREDRYQFKYLEQSFMAGFRGGLEAFFSPVKRHWISFGAYYEQRRVQVKIGDVFLSNMLLPAFSIQQMYFLNVYRYVDKSNIDTNYVTIPVGYRFHVLDEFYLGLCLDVAVLFQAKANYALISYSTHLNFMKYLSPVDFGGRLVFGFTMNKVFIEIGIGCGFLDIDRMAGERHTITINGMVGYRL